MPQNDFWRIHKVSDNRRGETSKSNTKASEKLNVERNPNLRDKERSKGKSCDTRWGLRKATIAQVVATRELGQ
ncbi:unnamed protein product, partial [Sphenostylis stenocarpa]